MTTPPVIEKQMVDIDLSGGLDESVRPEHLEWTKRLKRAVNVDFHDRGSAVVRNGFTSLASTDETSAAFSPVFQLVPTQNGVGFIGSGFRFYQYDEGSEVVRVKNRVPEFSVDPVTVASWPSYTGQERCLGTALTDEFKILLHTATGVNGEDGYMVLVITDRHSNNTVRAYLIPGQQSSGSNGCMCLVGGRYIHVYAASYLLGSGSTVVYQFDTQSLPIALPTPVGIASDHRVVACVGTTTHSVVLMENSVLVQVNTTPSQTATGTAASISLPGGLDWDGTNFYVSGMNATPRKVVQVLNASLSVTSTITGTDTDASSGDSVRIVHNGTQGFLLTYHDVGAYSEVQIDSVFGGAIQRIQNCPQWGEHSLPFYHGPSGTFYAVLQKRLADYNADIDERSEDLLSGGVVIIELNSNRSWAGPPAGFRIAAVLDGYNELATRNVSGDYGVFLSTQRPFISGNNITIGGACKATFGSVSFEFRHLRVYDASRVVSDVDVISGGFTSIYDGNRVQECGFVDTPSLGLESSAAGTDLEAGLRNYVAVYEFKDYAGRSHFSRCSRVASVTTDAGDEVVVTVTIPTISNHGIAHPSSTSTRSAIVARLYRTVSGGTQYHLLTSQTIETTLATSTAITYTDSTPDSELESNPLLYRQPGSQATALDRYHAPASSAVLRWKDRVLCARGSDVFFSSFAVDGEAPWFSPALRIVVPAGMGPITGLSELDGILVIFKQNAIYLVDGDGPPENGGSGTEFSPPRKVLTEFGCIDARSVVKTPNGIMYRSTRGIELLRKDFSVVFAGERVQRTVDANPYTGAGTFHSRSGRAMWSMADGAGDYEGQLTTDGSTGVIVVYEVSTDTWTTYSTIDPFQAIGTALVKLPAEERSTDHLMCVSSTYLAHENDIHRDVLGGVPLFISSVMETGYVRGPSKQDRVRVTDLFAAGLNSSPCNLSVSYAPDYSPSYTAIHTWTPTEIGEESLAQIEAQPAQELVQSMSFRVATEEPDSGATDGSQIEFFGLSVRVGLKGGGAKLSAAQKG